MGNSVTSIGETAFDRCPLTSIVLPKTVQTICGNSFSHSTVVSVDDENPYLTCTDDVIYNKSVSKIIFCPNIKTTFDIPNTVTEIGENSFRSCNKLTSIFIPNSVASIGQFAFYGCSGLTSLTIPNTLNNISDYTFANCDKLADIYCQATTPPTTNNTPFSNSIYSTATLYVHKGCAEAYKNATTWNSFANIVEAKLDDDIKVGDINYKITSDSEVTVVAGSKEYSGAIEIPSSINNGAYSVTAIGDGAFADCEALTSVVIPGSVTIIGSNAFKGCSGLASVTIGDGVSSIGDGAFEGCVALKKVNITDLAAWCKIKFPNIYANPMYYSHSLTLNGTEVKDLVIPGSVTKIGDYTFFIWYDLTSVTIPSSVTAIGDFAFGLCTQIANIYCYATTPPATNKKDQFCSPIYSKATLYVPVGCTAAYRATAPWSNFANIVEYDFSGVEDVITEEAASEVVGCYNMHGVMSAEPWSGVNIVVYSDGSRRKMFK